MRHFEDWISYFTTLSEAIENLSDIKWFQTSKNRKYVINRDF